MLLSREPSSEWRPSAAAAGPSTGFRNSEPQPLTTILLADVEQGAGQQLAKAVWNSRSPARVIATKSDRLGRFAPELAGGSCLPVGDSDYVRKAMAFAGVDPPPWNCYPPALAIHQVYRPHLTTASMALRWPKPAFVRPVASGLFKGFVMREDRHTMPPEANRQLDRLLALQRREPVWVCDALALRSTWRYYILRGDLIGYACIDGDELVEPELEDVTSILAAAPAQLAYALDLAILDNGATTLLTMRDAWGLEYPGAGAHAPRPISFLRMMWSRWKEMYHLSRAASRTSEFANS